MVHFEEAVLDRPTAMIEPRQNRVWLGRRVHCSSDSTENMDPDSRVVNYRGRLLALEILRPVRTVSTFEAQK
jgi:hypothetical protein